MDDWISVVALVLGIPALILAILGYRDTKRIRQDIDTSIGTPAVQIQWGKPNEARQLPCGVTALFNRASAVRLKVGKEEKTIDQLAVGEWKNLNFGAVPEGTKFKVSFTDPVEHQDYKRRGIIRYGQPDF